MTSVSLIELKQVYYMSEKGAQMIVDAGINKAELLVKETTSKCITSADVQFLGSLSAADRQLFINSIIFAQTHLRRRWPVSNLTASVGIYLQKKRDLVDKIMGLPLCIQRNIAEIIAFSKITWPNLTCPHDHILRVEAIEVFDRVASSHMMGPGQAECVYCAILKIMAYRQGADPNYPPIGIPNRTPPN
ncbi:MAG: hypothetical protein A4E32_01715 [Methanomassiliicoccales archaeon PtaU1.Bin124]|nr:MAG: hypothetical protein A4E32_01715 [Methanomassiliicoccales archaeon PtaU1.Bin124]